jgi:hypothetical protein
MKRTIAFLLCSLTLLLPAALWAVEAPLSADTYIDGANPATNFGAAGNLNAGGSSHTLIRFDLSTLPAGTTAADIGKATLLVYINQLAQVGWVDLAPVTSVWSEQTVTFGTAPATGAAIATVNVPQAGFLQMDITSLVKNWVNAPASNFGLEISGSVMNAPAGLGLDSKENVGTGHLPRLDITLGGPLLVEAPGPGNTSMGNGALAANTTGQNNTASGYGSLGANTTGSANTADGSFALFSNTTGTSNTAIGTAALGANSTGTGNTALGTSAMYLNTTGNYNTALGGTALVSNVSGKENTAAGNSALQANGADDNTAVGFSALKANTFGTANTATGAYALQSNTTANANAAFGFSALKANTGTDNTGIGAWALASTTTGNLNTASGSNALRNNTTGQNDTAVGAHSLERNTTGQSNTALGSVALDNNTTGSSNTAIGEGALINNISGGSNIALGNSAGWNILGSNNIDIGSTGMPPDAATIRIGDTHQTRAFIAGIRGVQTGVGDAVAVMIDSNGQLGTASSSRRFKDEIQDMRDASSALMRLRPVTFRYKQPSAEGSRPLEYGLIAEEVAEVYPGLVTYAPDGQVETVQYHKVNAMLLNEVQKQHQLVQSFEARLAALEEAIQVHKTEEEITK